MNAISTDETETPDNTNTVAYGPREGYVFVIVIYDISSNKKRLRLFKLLKSYGFRVQKSAFEAEIEKSCYAELLKKLSRYGNEHDSVRIYRIIGEGHITSYGGETADMVAQRYNRSSVIVV